MSNAGRPRTGLKPCPHCQSTERDSNGQCHCRNVAYRLGKKEAKKNADVLPKAPTKKTAKDAKKATPAAKKAAEKKGADIVDKAVAEAVAASKPEPTRYILNTLDDFTDPKAYARRDAAIKNGVRSGERWTVTYKGKVVAASDDV